MLNKPVQLPREPQKKENRPIITYTLTNTIRNKILNYKDTVSSIYVEDEILFTLNTDLCECEHSPFIDSHHKHIIIGHLRVVGNSKLRKLLTKGPNCRESRSTDFNKAFAKITTGLDNVKNMFLNMLKIFIIKAHFIQVTKNSELWQILFQ